MPPATLLEQFVSISCGERIGRQDGLHECCGDIQVETLTRRQLDGQTRRRESLLHLKEAEASASSGQKSPGPEHAL